MPGDPSDCRLQEPFLAILAVGLHQHERLGVFHGGSDQVLQVLSLLRVARVGGEVEPGADPLEGRLQLRPEGMQRVRYKLHETQPRTVPGRSRQFGA